MFGSKKKKSEGYIREIFDKITQNKGAFESGITKLEDDNKRISTDITQVMENTKEMTENAALNIQEESALLHTMDDYSKEVKGAYGEYVKLRSAIENQLQDTRALVEKNKHFTTPTKQLTVAPSVMKQTCKSYDKQLDKMADCGKRIGALASNASFEAEKMGAQGKQFVNAVEEIKKAASIYEKAALAMKEDVENSRTKIADMEDTIQRLVSLLKENNVETSKLFKKSQDIKTMLDRSTMRDFSEDMVLMRDKVVGIRNLDEEIAKIGERNKLQLNDIQEDMQTQKKELAEVESDLVYMLDTIEEQLR